MSRYQRAEIILQAAKQWVDACLLGGGSIFSKNQLWNKANFATLQRHYSDNLRAGEGTFFEKLKSQLEPAPPTAKQLAAEMFWVLCLVVVDRHMKAKTKRFQIQEVRGWSGDALDVEQWAFNAPLDEGLASPGIAFLTYRWREFQFFVATMVDWFALDEDQQRNLLKDPWVFSQWLGQREGAKGRALRDILAYLLFPDHHECILTMSHKRDIIKGFHQHWELSNEVDYNSAVTVDQAILAIRKRLEAASGNEEVNFYFEPHRSVWQAKPSEASVDQETPLASLETAQTWINNRFGNAGFWVLAAGQGGRQWSNFQRDEVAAIDWDGFSKFLCVEAET